LRPGWDATEEESKDAELWDDNWDDDNLDDEFSIQLRCGALLPLLSSCLP
jgi:hypothetical protein